MYGLFFYDMLTPKKAILFVSLSILMQVPLLYVVLKDKIRIPFHLDGGEANGKAFLAGAPFWPS